MYRSAREGAVVREESPAGGRGVLEKQLCMTQDDALNPIEFVSRVFLKPDGVVGMHRHEGNGEIWFFIRGEGVYTEDGISTDVCAGDVALCHTGSSHGLRNTGAEDLEYLAVKYVVPS